MKTLLPIVISLGLLIPFSPVGEYLWHTTQQQSQSLLTASQQQVEHLANTLTQRTNDLTLWWQQSTTALQAGVAHNQQQLQQRGQTLAQNWQQQHEQWTSELGQRWQIFSSDLVQWPQQQWQEVMNSGESQWANLLQQQEQLQLRMSHSLTRLEARIAAQTE